MRLAREGYPFVWIGVAVTVSAAAAAAVVGGWSVWLALLLAVLTVFVLFFFRDPDRVEPDHPRAVLAAADGRVVDVAEVDEPSFMGGRCRRISIFLSIFNVHVQRSPVSGKVAHRSYRSGGYAIAWKPKASADNEQASLGLETAAGRVLVRQIAGLVARRIVTYPEEGESVERGQRIGLIRFGSRVDVFVPLDWTVRCEPGDRAIGGLTVLAEIPEADGRAEDG